MCSWREHCSVCGGVSVDVRKAHRVAPIVRCLYSGGFPAVGETSEDDWREKGEERGRRGVCT